jgi:hypothetical protein
MPTDAAKAIVRLNTEEAQYRGISQASRDLHQ